MKRELKIGDFVLFKASKTYTGQIIKITDDFEDKTNCYKILATPNTGYTTKTLITRLENELKVILNYK